MRIKKNITIKLKGLSLLCILVLLPLFSFSAIITSASTGNWNVGATWVGGVVPAAGDDAVIASAHTVTLDQERSITNFTINSGGILRDGNFNLTVSGNLVINGIYEGGNGGGGGTGQLLLTGASATINGTGTINNVNRVQVAEAITQTILAAANITFTGTNQRIIILNSATVTNNGVITLKRIVGNTASAAWVNNAATAKVNVSEDFMATGLLTATEAGNTINYNGSIAQNIKATDAGYYHLTISGSGNKTLLADTDINGNLSIQGTAVLSASTFNISLAGNWDNSSTAADPFIQGIQTVTFDGSAEQTIGAALAQETFFNLSIANTSGGITLLGSTDINTTNILTFTSGVVRTAESVFILSNTSAANLSYSSGFIIGNFRRFIASNSSNYLFPVGNGTASTDRHRVSFVNNSLAGVSYLDVSVTDFTQSAPNNDAALGTTQSGTSITSTAAEAAGQTVIWTITPNAVPTGGNYGVQLYIENTNLSAGDDNTFCPLKRNVTTTYANFLTEDGTTSIPAAGAAGRIYSAGSGYAQRTGYTSFSQFVIGKAPGPLPVELLSFTANCIPLPDGQQSGSANVATEGQQGVGLKWSTASEINNDYFEIQRNDGMGEDWKVVGSVNGAGNSYTIRSYEFLDLLPSPNREGPGVRYYRLKQTDYDGKYEYFGPVSVSFSYQDADIVVLPNPSSGVFSIIGLSPNSELSVYTVSGEKVYMRKTTNEFITIDLSDNSEGVYFLTVMIEKESFAQKIVILR